MPLDKTCNSSFGEFVKLHRLVLTLLLYNIFKQDKIFRVGNSTQMSWT